MCVCAVRPPPVCVLLPCESSSSPALLRVAALSVCLCASQGKEGEKKNASSSSSARSPPSLFLSLSFYARCFRRLSQWERT